jgi:hypothetical protein
MRWKVEGGGGSVMKGGGGLVVGGGEGHKYSVSYY